MIIEVPCPIENRSSFMMRFDTVREKVWWVSPDFAPTESLVSYQDWMKEFMRTGKRRPDCDPALVLPEGI